MHASDKRTLIVFLWIWVYLQFKWDQLSSNNSHHTSCIYKGLVAGKCPDLLTSKPDAGSTLMLSSSELPMAIQSFNHLHNWSTLEDHWSNKFTGMPLEPHWLMLAPSGKPVLICIIGTQWRTTGSTLEAHWLPTIISPVAFQCTLGSKFKAQWTAFGLPLNHHCPRVGEDTLGYHD